MLKAEFRLKKKKDFEDTYRKGKKIISKAFLIKIRRNELSETRVGFVVSKKTVKKIVSRNRLKRRMREIVRKLEDNLVIGNDIIIIAKSNASNQKYDEMEVEINVLLQNAKLIKNEDNKFKNN
jgi:ribonuclease P protein component